MFKMYKKVKIYVRCVWAKSNKPASGKNKAKIDIFDILLDNLAHN